MISALVLGFSRDMNSSFPPRPSFSSSIGLFAKGLDDEDEDEGSSTNFRLPQIVNTHL